MKILTTVFTLLLLSPVSAAEVSDPYCEYFLTEARIDLKAAAVDQRQFLDKLNIDLSSFEPVEALGWGASGHVFKVRKGDQYFALKIFRPDSPESHPRSSIITDLSNDLEPNHRTETTEGIVIQYVLGRMELAPTVRGTANSNGIQAWVQKNSERLEQLTGERYSKVSPDVRYALLMDFEDGVSLKASRGRKLVLESYQWERVQARAKMIVQVLKSLQVFAVDPDAHVTSKGNILLMDLSYYSFKPQYGELVMSDDWLFQRLEDLRRSGSLIVRSGHSNH